MQRAASFLAGGVMSSEDDGFHCLVVGQHGEEHVGVQCGIVRGIRHACTISAQLFSAAVGTVVHGQRVPGPSDVPRHRLPHVAEPDESDIHAVPLLWLWTTWRGWVCPAQEGHSQRRPDKRLHAMSYEDAD